MQFPEHCDEQFYMPKGLGRLVPAAVPARWLQVDCILLRGGKLSFTTFRLLDMRQ